MTERRRETLEEFLAATQGDIDPAKYAGEAFYATEEYPRWGDIDSAQVQGEMGSEGDYYPGPMPAVMRRKMRRY